MDLGWGVGVILSLLGGYAVIIGACLLIGGVVEALAWVAYALGALVLAVFEGLNWLLDRVSPKP